MSIICNSFGNFLTVIGISPCQSVLKSVLVSVPYKGAEIFSLR